MIIKHTLIALLVFSSNNFTFGQQNDKFFKSDKYQPQEYPKFEGTTEFNQKDSSFKFWGKVILLNREDSKFKNFLLSGAFNPDLIFGKETTVFDKEEYESMDHTQKILFNLGRNDSISICCFQSFEKINPDPTVRRYSFWFFRKMVANPTEYYIEFYNPKATRETSTEEFGKDAVMTFFYQNGIII